MSLAELLPRVQNLDDDDKTRLRDHLNRELERALLLDQLVRGGPYEIWSPFDCHEAAHVLSKMLEERKGKS